MRRLKGFRLAAVALALSAALHAAVFVGMPRRLAAIEGKDAAVYSATLEAAPAPAAMQAAAPAPAPRAKPPRRAARPKAPALSPELLPVEEAPGEQVAMAEGVVPLPSLEPYPEPSPELLPAEEPPGQVALAEAAVPLAAIEPEKFPVEALPASISISYHLTSAFADGRAVYHWDRDGDNYRITGEAEAEGFFTLFLEGQITQESRGTVTEQGLRPDRFVERRPNAGPEGLEFDWPGRQVTFERAGKRDTSALEGHTVDWLSMIFQMAHVPPEGGALDMQVFTQRRLYRFKLQVLGVEEISIPLGTVRALHLRHVDPRDDREAVDVWLGLEQHYLPVKLRFPVARNRLVVEQVATRVTSRKSP